tara:strand:- start:2579 stop:4042 length:1464 start_codon:yes stop_codon:yes gene_type:complete
MTYIDKISVINKNDIGSSSTGLLAIGVFEGKKLTDFGYHLDESGQNVLSKAFDLGDLKGKHGEANMFYINGKRVLLIGLGKKKKLNAHRVRLAAGQISNFAIKKKIDSMVVECFCSSSDSCQAMAEGLVLGSYQFLDYKTKKSENFELHSVNVAGCDKSAVLKGSAIAQAVCFSRDLANHPGNVTTPSKLAEEAKQIAKEGSMDCTVFDREEFTSMGMGGLAGVSQGTDEPPKFILLEYFGSDKSKKPIVLVGKGLTFDAGGISIKPSSRMDEMKYDMCGSAVVLGVFKALAVLKPKLNIIGIIPSTENLVGAKAYKPGDILTAYNGKTIEVLNTDAEGRLILADGLSYACKHYKPEYILDFATLTGAVLVALGHIATGVLGTNEQLMEHIKKSSKNTNEKVWELPLWPEFQKQVRSKIADVKNTGAPRQAGTIAGAAFLKEFVEEDIPWVHFDIAGTAWGGNSNSINPKGSATGWGVRLVIDLLNV